MRTLIRHVPPQDVPALSAVLEGAEARPQTGAGRLLSFYICRALKAAQEPDPVVCQPARMQLEAIRAGLARVDMQPRVAVAPPPAAVSHAPMDVEAVSDAIRSVYRLTVRRDAVDEEVGIWLGNLGNGLPFHEFLTLMEGGDEAQAKRAAEAIGGELSDGEFVLALFGIIAGRGCNGYELDAVRSRLEAGGITRSQLLAEFFMQALEAERSRQDEAVHDGLSCSIMGTQRFLTLAEWQQKAQDAEVLAQARAALRPATPFRFSAEPGVEITAIASLFRGGDFIEQFMDNITSQSCFDRHCELIIVDADSPENEAETIARYLDRHPGVRYQRMNSRVGIYEAWNIGVQMARGRYLTNTNLDDLRRRDSLEIQAGALQTLPFADVIYQDFYYSFDPGLDWEGVAAFGYKSELPLVTPHNMLRFNSPHNAPMWRKSLHDELGLFDGSFRSAGDYEFWLRCLVAGKTFYKVNEPHVVYYQNPKGLSTRADTRGIVEAKAIMKKYAPLLQSRMLAGSLDDFLAGLGSTDIPAETIAGRDRHIIAQAALRGLSRRFKQAGN